MSILKKMFLAKSLKRSDLAVSDQLDTAVYLKKVQEKIKKNRRHKKRRSNKIMPLNRTRRFNNSMVDEDFQNKFLPMPIRPRSKSQSNLNISSLKTFDEFGAHNLRSLFDSEKFSHACNPKENHRFSGTLRAKMIDWMVECLSVFGL